MKTTCVNLSVKCNMSAEMSRVAVQTVCKNLYDNNYFLSKDEAIERDPPLSEYKQDNPPSNKRQKLDLPTKQVPKSLNEYKTYKNVLLSAKTINDYKLTLAPFRQKKRLQQLCITCLMMQNQLSTLIQLKSLKLMVTGPALYSFSKTI